MSELTNTTSEYQDLKRNMIGHTQMTQEKDERIEKLKKQLQETQTLLEETEIKFGSAQIELQKVKDQLGTGMKDLTDTTDKLHKTNKARHEIEIKYGEAMEKVKALQEGMGLKDDQLERKT